jgi:hypothetical protein
MAVVQRVEHRLYDVGHVGLAVNRAVGDTVEQLAPLA